MLVDGLPDYQTDHGPVDYAAIAQAAGLYSVRLEQPAEVKGFALAATKIVLTGGVGEMLKLARANLRNIPRPAIVR